MFILLVSLFVYLLIKERARAPELATFAGARASSRQPTMDPSAPRRRKVDLSLVV